jgi:hypothetical protein
MTMKNAVLLTLVLTSAPALADFECPIVQQCGGGICEVFTGGSLLLREEGDVWQVSIDDQTWQGYATVAPEAGSETSIVLPPQNGVSGLISVYPSNEVSFTVHAYGEGPVAITGSGSCTSGGG